jgi:putative flippase GtrA
VKPSSLKSSLRRWALFLVGGGLNTILTYGIYLTLNIFVGYQISYGIAYVCGIIFSYLFNSKLVFEVRRSWKGLLLYPFVYVLQYLGAALLLGFAVESAGIPKEVAPLLIIVLMLPVTYLMSKLILKATDQSKIETDPHTPNDK